MRVIHHLYKHVLPQRRELFSEKNYASEIKNVRMAAVAGPRGVIYGPTVTVRCCGDAIKHRLFKGFKVAFSALASVSHKLRINTAIYGAPINAFIIHTFGEKLR